MGRVQDVEEGISEMPHVLINQARIHDMFLDVMKNAPTRLEPDYNLKIADLDINPDGGITPLLFTLNTRMRIAVAEKRLYTQNTLSDVTARAAPCAAQSAANCTGMPPIRPGA